MAVALLLLIVLAGYGWQHVPIDAQADVASIGAHVVILALVVLVGVGRRSLWPVLGLQAGFSLQSAGCSAAYLIAPWPVDPGAEQCSARLGLPLGLMGLVAALLILSHLTRRRHGNLNS